MLNSDYKNTTITIFFELPDIFGWFSCTIRVGIHHLLLVEMVVFAGCFEEKHAAGSKYRTVTILDLPCGSLISC